MNNYNGMINSHFAGKQQISSMEDTGRKRIIRIFYLDSEEVVGLSDGTDAWVADPNGCCHDLKLPSLLQKVKDGTFQFRDASPSQGMKRKRVMVEETIPSMSSCPTTRRRVHVR